MLSENRLKGKALTWGFWRVSQVFCFCLASVVVGLIFLSTVFAASPGQLNHETKSLRWVAFGDSGSGAVFQKEIAQRMLAFHQLTPFSMMLMLGDNIYPDGNVEKYGKDRLLLPYEPLRARSVQLHAVLGNHDVLWKNGAPMVRMLSMPGRFYQFTEGSVDFFALDTNQFDDVQQQWLKNALASSKAPWKVVFGHHPVFSSGLHGDNAHLIKTLRPLLAKYHVSLYLAGHDHNYERFKPIESVTYVVSGGGGAWLRKFGKISSHSQVRKSVHHFLYLQANPEQLQVQAIDKTGHCFDRVTLTRSALRHKA
ncbi:MAG: metallophosphoesterase [Candidatus Melainabacteria bacterium]|nr:metallophosphoesterase [Candidatus Melainabacteria bacterium]